MNEKTTISKSDLENGAIKEGTRYKFGDGEEQIVVAVQKLNEGYWIKTQESEALFDFNGKIMVLSV